MKYIDLNCDMGELPKALADQEAIMPFISSVNIACGGHAGDANTMRTTIEQALWHKVAVGAHPGYEDPANFGRLELRISFDEIASSVHRQILALDQIATRLGARIGHVKAHGALYNQAAQHREIARAIADGVKCWRTDVILVGLAGSVMLEEFQAAGFAVAAEAFADRVYQSDGSLRSRKLKNSLLTDPQAAAEQALQIVRERTVTAADGRSVSLRAQTICIHGDTIGAAEIAAQVRGRLEQAGLRIAALDVGMPWAC
jgi:5-oxoprolinase (ATP-hydrolysing) subunit A